LIAKIIRCDCCGTIVDDSSGIAITSQGLDFCQRCKREVADLIERVLKNEWQRKKIPVMILGPLVETLAIEKMREAEQKASQDASKPMAATATAAGFA